MTKDRAQHIWDNRDKYYGWQSTNPLPEMTDEERAFVMAVWDKLPGCYSFATTFHAIRCGRVDETGIINNGE